MLVEAAIFDAYGAAFENVADVRKTNDRTYRKHPKWNLGNGRYTDDTQMMIALSEFILSGESSPLALANSFVQCYKRDSRPGYMGGFRKLLDEIKDGAEFLKKIRPYSKRSGAAMRAAPYGLLKERSDVIDMAMFQASLTHATKEGMDSAAAAAMLVWLCRDGCDRRKLGTAMKEFVPGYSWDTVWSWRVPTDGIPVVRAALTALRAKDHMADILWLSVAFTGDTDTVGAVAGAAASWHPDIIQDIPPHLYEGLENGPYGRDFLEILDWKLLRRFDLPHPHGKECPENIKQALAPKEDEDLDVLIAALDEKKDDTDIFDVF